MRSPQPITVVIACPHCGTRYQVPPDTLGAKGRSVSCAHCGQAWLAHAPKPPPAPRPIPAPAAKGDDRLFTPSEEEALDREFTAVEQRNELAGAIGKLLPKDTGAQPAEVMKSIAEIKAAISPRAPDPPAEKPTDQPVAAKATEAVGDHSLPLARLYPALRIATVVALVGIIAGGVLFRTEIVRVLPDLAGIYETVGLGVNVVGLEFSDVTTLTTRRGEDSALTVTAEIRSITGRRVAVPPVVVTLLDEQGAGLYEWSVTPPAADIAPGELVELSAELAAPPEGATELRLSFAETKGAKAAATAPEPAPAAEPVDLNPAGAEPPAEHAEETNS
jgi:predicted Zn finger-like uncharacterized protein